MAKYGVIVQCGYCNSTFETKRRFLTFCSTKCKNPINRGELVPWNKGIKYTEEQKNKINMEGLKLGRGWSKGIPNVRQSIKWKAEGNPNFKGAVNKIRKEKGTLSCPGERNGMYGKNHTNESKEKMREAKLKNYLDGIYKYISKGECIFAENLKDAFPDLVWQFKIKYHNRAYDFFIPSLNLIVEYDGDYWHREDKYLDKDFADSEFAKNQGYNIYRYWESTIKEKGMDTILQDIKNLKGQFSRKFKEKI